ncbi:unnamed protein product [Hymenolepis diminuta]|uniref:Radial spoke head protein 6 homolog A n=1 Tax=Hymenolepis diminuta TaxID=6216 RepID=A0A0R3SBQ8_HYMDI|nr:unnamed protein product [Hymenolepis diminuta]
MCDYFKIKLAIKKLTTDYPIDSVRFWGKVFGTQNDYYIIECKPGDSDAFQHSEGMVDDPDVQEPAEKDTKQDPPLPKSKWKPPPDVPAEEIGEGVNNRVYFVSSHACGPYTLLPLCQPKHVAASRMIRSYFTGDLTSKVSCWPPFPGTEAQYLRAQIARISSGTILSPRGFFRFLQEEEQSADLSDEEDEVLPIECEEDEEYVPLAIEAMELSDWVHSRPYILPQGRVTWINLKDFEGSESEESESEENDTVPSLKGLEDEPPKREKGPPILTPISEDLAINGHEPWRLKKFRDRSHLLISSLLWPGAHTAAKGGTFESIYVGWGLKATEVSKLPSQLLQAQSEILHEPEEMIDPTPEEEKCKEANENGEEGEEEGEEDEESEEIEISNPDSERA